MTILNVTILAFVLLESLNVLILYQMPATKRGNGLGVFKPYGTLQQKEDTQLFVRYLTHWVANTKVIFIMLLFIIVWFGDETLKHAAILGLLLSISLYYFKLHPILRTLDHKGHIEPKGYSKTLLIMIGSIQAVLLVSVLLYSIFF